MSDPIFRFQQLMERAREAGVVDPTAMALATADENGRPSVRMVLLKAADDDGFVFYTNLESRKADELDRNPWAALCFHWQPLEAQVRIEGHVQRVSDDEADAYFASRPRGSQIGAWSSMQSQPLSAYRVLEERVVEITNRFADGPIPRPPFWSGYRLVPVAIEFWSGRPSRLHERERYSREGVDEAWTIELLYP